MSVFRLSLAGLVFLYFSTSLVGQGIKKIYLESIYDSGGISAEEKNRVRNQISINVYKHFKKTHTLIDDVIINGYLNQLKKQQQLGCDTAKCYKMIEDSLNPDEKISGSIVFSNGKYTLTLRLIDLSGGKGMVDVKEITYSKFQMEYCIEEMTRALLDTKYRINLKDMPPEFKEEVSDFGNIRIQSIEGLDIKLYEFKANETKVDLILKSLRKKLEEGDRLFSSKKYNESGEVYQSILESIRSSLTLDTRKSIIAYEDGITARRNFSYFNSIRDEITALDDEFSKMKSNSPETIKSFLKKYELIYNKQNRLSPDKQKEILSSLGKRIESLNVKLFQFQEDRGDDHYEKFYFTEAYREYKDILLSLQNKEGDLYTPFKARIQKKISTTESTGKSFVQSRVKSYNDLAEKEFLDYNLKKNEMNFIERIQSEEKIEKYLEESERILKKSDFSSPESIESYNRLVSLINENRSKTNRIGRFYHKDDAFSSESLNQLQLEKSFFFPGYGQITFEPGEYKSKFMYYGGWASFWYVLYAGNKTTINYSRFTGFERTSTFYFSRLDTNTVNFIILQDTLRKDSLESDYKSSATEFNLALGIFASFYLVSLLDAYLSTGNPSTIGRAMPKSPELPLGYGNLRLNATSNQSQFAPEFRYGLEYSIRF